MIQPNCLASSSSRATLQQIVNIMVTISHNLFDAGRLIEIIQFLIAHQNSYQQFSEELIQFVDNYIMLLIAQLLILSIAVSVATQQIRRQSAQNELPDGFVYLEDYHPNIINNLRYASQNNFVGRRIPNYNGQSVICTEEAAIALTRAQNKFQSFGYSLVIYDAYRPASSTKFFVDWTKDLSDVNQTSKQLYYPYIQKQSIVPEGYIAEKSGHNRGSTLDLTIIKIGESLKPLQKCEYLLNDGTIINIPNDNTVSMGGGFDLFHKASHHGTTLIREKETDNRNFLLQIMQQSGFKKLQQQWWHYTLKDQPFPETYFDFPIINRNTKDQ